MTEKKYPLMKMAGGAETYVDPTRAEMDWYGSLGYFHGKVPKIQIKQGEAKAGKEGNYSYVVGVTCTDKDEEGKRQTAWITFTGKIKKTAKKNAGKENAEVFVPPFMRAAGKTLEETRELMKTLEDPEEFVKLFEGSNVLYRIYESKDREAGPDGKKKIRQRLAWVTPEDFATAEEGGESVMRAPLSPALKKQIEGGDEPAETVDAEASTEQESDF